MNRPHPDPQPGHTPLRTLFRYVRALERYALDLEACQGPTLTSDCPTCGTLARGHHRKQEKCDEET